jgi:hypothetical protein
VLWALGLYLGGLANQDLAVRCAQGTAGGDARTERKRALTKQASSRWAGAITRTSNDQWERGLRNRRDQQRAIASIERRVAVPVGERGGRSRGYANQAERFQKQRRPQMLKGRLAQLEAGRVSVTRGGRELARLRHNLEPAGLSEARWRERWEAERLFITADGEADKYLGNETIRWHPEQQWLEIKLPGRLAFLANRAHGRYRLDCQVSFRHRGSEVAQPGRGWGDPLRHQLPAGARALVPGRLLAAAGWSGSGVGGSPVGRRAGRGSQRWASGGLGAGPGRQSRLPTAHPPARPGGPEGLDSGRQARVKAIAIEDLDFVDACQPTARNLRFRGDPGMGRETMGRGQRGKRWRRSVAGLPTARFRDRLLQICRNAGIWVVAVDPAYTSKWGEANWRAPLDKQTKASITVSRHQAAAVVIGRRSLGHRARRRPDVTDTHRRMGGRELSVRPSTGSGGSGPWPSPEATAHPRWGQDAGWAKERGGGPGHRGPFAVARWTISNVRC